MSLDDYEEHIVQKNNENELKNVWWLKTKRTIEDQDAWKTEIFYWSVIVIENSNISDTLCDKIVVWLAACSDIDALSS